MSYFDEKASQLGVGTIEAFGIELQTRRNRAGEMPSVSL